MLLLTNGMPLNQLTTSTQDKEIQAQSLINSQQLYGMVLHQTTISRLPLQEDSTMLSHGTAQDVRPIMELIQTTTPRTSSHQPALRYAKMILPTINSESATKRMQLRLTTRGESIILFQILRLITILQRKPSNMLKTWQLDNSCQHSPGIAISTGCHSQLQEKQPKQHQQPNLGMIGESTSTGLKLVHKMHPKNSQH